MVHYGPSYVFFVTQNSASQRRRLTAVVLIGAALAVAVAIASGEQVPALARFTAELMR